MGRKLAGYVHVHDGAGNSHVFGPADSVPPELAKLITNPGVWAEEPDADGEPSDSWTVPDLKAYAELHEIDLGEATKKADILAAIRADEGDGSPAV